MSAILLITIDTVTKADGKKELVVGKTVVENPRSTETEKLVNECLAGAIDLATEQIKLQLMEIKS